MSKHRHSWAEFDRRAFSGLPQTRWQPPKVGSGQACYNLVDKLGYLGKIDNL
jgi:hypothetical protein